jgi:hypothetical protein
VVCACVQTYARLLHMGAQALVAQVDPVPRSDLCPHTHKHKRERERPTQTYIRYRLSACPAYAPSQRPSVRCPYIHTHELADTRGPSTRTHTHAHIGRQACRCVGRGRTRAQAARSAKESAAQCTSMYRRKKSLRVSAAEGSWGRSTCTHPGDDRHRVCGKRGRQTDRPTARKRERARTHRQAQLSVIDDMGRAHRHSSIHPRK